MIRVATARGSLTVHQLVRGPLRLRLKCGATFNWFQTKGLYVTCKNCLRGHKCVWVINHPVFSQEARCEICGERKTIKNIMEALV